MMSGSSACNCLGSFANEWGKFFFMGVGKKRERTGSGGGRKTGGRMHKGWRKVKGGKIYRSIVRIPHPLSQT